jgi:hypothetical protein
MGQKLAGKVAVITGQNQVFQLSWTAVTLNKSK